MLRILMIDLISISHVVAHVSLRAPVRTKLFHIFPLGYKAQNVTTTIAIRAENATLIIM